jgi:hypothetical protein
MLFRSLPAIVVAGALAVASSSAQTGPGLASRVRTLTRTTSWKLVSSLPFAFRTFHPQGMVKIGDTFFVSAVEVLVPTERFPQPLGGYDRSPGEGKGHLFKIDRQGRLLGETTLGEGSLYHPGGLDFDGTNLWLPVAEYRPDSRSIVYRVDPASLAATEVLRVSDHIGGIVHNTDDHTLHGVSWGSRRFYRWTLDARGRVGTPGTASPALNSAHYVDYQDCKYAAVGMMLCTGVADFRQSATAPVFRLGGIELVSLRDGRPVHQAPISLWTPTGRPLTQNPSWFEATTTGLRGYFLPDDDTSTLFVYETEDR